MSNLSWNEIQDRATEFASKWAGETYEKGESQSFWSDFLAIYGIDRRRHGAFFEYAIKKGSGSQGFIDMFWPGKLLAEQKSGGKDLGKAGVQAYEYLETMPDHDLPQGIVVSDFASFEFIDLETREKTSFQLADLPRNVKLFGFLIDQTSQKLAEEDPVNRKAAESMARLHNQLRDDNYTGHDLEVLLVRLVFCMFADDSGIFDRHVLHDYLHTRTSQDGSDLGPRLMQIFQALNTPSDHRQSSLDEAIASLPYVNGGLFDGPIRTPYFTSSMRRDLLAAMELDWSKVSPAIFGSMFQGVMDEQQRRNLGAHYTSEKNILRVIKPLFLDELYDEYAKALKSGPRKKFDELRQLQDKLAELKFLDPACGSGNFLIIAYRELRRLEHKIVAQLAKNADQQDMLASAGQGVGSLRVNVDQMYGIEIEEFPSLIAQTALWLTDHQMNMEFSRESGRTFRRLPLKHSATIVNANALTIDWTEVVAPSELDYIMGNPPFYGSRNQDADQKEAFANVFQGIKSFGVLDFVAGWYKLASEYMKSNKSIQAAFVSTNSISQGEQVVVLWKPLIDQGIKINFAHNTFKWGNDAKNNAAVYCVIVGFSNEQKPRRLFDYPDIKGEPVETTPANINPYLLDAPTLFVTPSSRPPEGVLPMMKGNALIDNGNFIIESSTEKLSIIQTEPNLIKYIRPYVGSVELLNGGDRWVFYLRGYDPSDLTNSTVLRERINGVREFRKASKKAQTRKFAELPTEYMENRQPTSDYLMIPVVSSENRNYVPVGFMSADIVASYSSFVLPNATLYEFAMITSQMHMAWMRTVCGRLKSDYRYSNTLVYNNFIWPSVTDAQKAEIEKLAQNVLDARTEFPESSLADLYDPLTMPPVLAKAHKALDKAVDKLYSPKPFATDADRVAMLFEKYQRVENRH